MSVTLSIQAFSGKDSPEFQKHFKAVKFCLENDLSFPKETSEFFKGKVEGENLEAYKREVILEYIENGVEVPLKVFEGDEHSLGGNTKEVHRIKVADIPSSVDEIIVTLS